MKGLTTYLSTAYCYDRARRVQHFLEPILLASLMIGLCWALFIAPTDLQQGQGYRILYVHVPCAILSLNLYLCMGVFGFVFLIWRIKMLAILIPCLAKMGTLYALLALITGSIWGKPMWGSWWVWDARLTSTLILFFCYLGILGLARTLQGNHVADKAISILALVGSINVPIVHYSVTWWNTLHQGATVTRFWAPTMATSMLKPLGFVLFCFIMYTVIILCQLVRQAISIRESQTAWFKARIIHE